MKKILTVILISFFLPFSAGAETLMGFLDGNMYDPATGTWKCMYLMDGNCYSLDQKILTTRPVSSQPQTVIAPSTPQTVYVPIYISPTTQPFGGIIEAQPIINNETITMPEFNPFAGSPAVTSEPEMIGGKKQVTLSINLSTPQSTPDEHQEIYRLFCVTPLYPNGVHLSTTPGVNNSQPDYTKRVATVNTDFGTGNYSCKFKFVLPQGTFESEAVEFSL